MPTTRLTVIAPVYNEEEVIEDFHTHLVGVLDSLDSVETRIVYVVDRCTDNTLDILRQVVHDDPRAKVLSLSSRFGHQMSLIAGIDHSLESDAIIMMDSDLQHPPELIPELMDRFRQGYEVVYTVRKDTEDISPLRKMAGNVFYWMLTKLSRIPMNANAADFRLISQRVARVLSMDFHERNIFLRGLFSWMGFRQVGVEYVAHRRSGGRSKYSITRMVQFALTGIVSFSIKPLQFITLLGVAISLMSFLLLVWVVVQYFVDLSIPSGWTTIAVLLLLFSGIQLITLGIIGNYIGGIYEEVKARPRYIIEEEIVHE